MARKPPLFLERNTYRYRRAVDAARLLPVLGVFLWLIPAFWSQSDTSQTSLSQAMIYIFLVWLGLIGLCAFVSSRLARRGFDPQQRPEPEPAEGHADTAPAVSDQRGTD